MKKSTQVMNLPIISISDGDQIGQVKSLVINPDKFSVEFLTIEQEDWQISVKAIPFKKVIGVGEYAVTVENESAIIDLNEIPIANQLLNKKVGLVGSRVMTRKGELLGQILEYYLNEENGNLVGLSLKVREQDVILPMDNVITLGKEMVIVNEHAKDAFLTAAGQLSEEHEPEAVRPLQPAVSEPEAVTPVQPAAQKLEAVTSVQPAAPEPEAETFVQPAAPEPEAKPIQPGKLELQVEWKTDEKFEALKSKQVELLKGKTVTKNIYNKDGNLLFSEGTILSEDDVITAQEAGPSVFVELSMNVTE